MNHYNSLLLTSCLGLLYLLSSCSHQQPPRATATYKTLITTTDTCYLSHSFAATIKGEEAVEIRPQISGTLARICIDEGQGVRKGQVLFVIDQVAYQAALQIAQAREKSALAALENAKLTFASKEALHKQHIVSDYDLSLAQNALTTAQATYATAQAEMLTARNNFSYTEIKSPTDGVIGMIAYRTGALVNPSSAQPLTLVSNNTNVRAYFSVSESYLQELLARYGSTSKMLKELPPVQLKLSNGALYEHTGHIDAISGQVDIATGAINLRATFPNPEQKLRNGSSGTVILPFTVADQIVIPQEATFELQDKIFVYKVVDGKATSTEIKVLPQNDGKNYVVLEGLTCGEEIIAEGAGLMREGTPVTTMPKQPTQDNQPKE
ncbi:MAG: efflux RND transporter periplasmic adaptor subunit [Bacteroides sp.]